MEEVKTQPIIPQVQEPKEDGVSKTKRSGLQSDSGSIDDGVDSNSHGNADGRNTKLDVFSLIPEEQKAIELVNDEGEVKEVVMLDDNEPIFQTPFRQLIEEAFEQGKHFFLAKTVTRRQKGIEGNAGGLNGSGTNQENSLVGMFDDQPPNADIEEIKQQMGSGYESTSKKQQQQRKQSVDFVEGFEDAMNHSHFFSAYSILRLIFKMKGSEFVGRFHENYPITVKNPITNQVSIFVLVVCVLSYFNQILTYVSYVAFLQRIIGEIEFYKVTNSRIEATQRRAEQDLYDKKDDKD